MLHQSFICPSLGTSINSLVQTSLCHHPNMYICYRAANHNHSSGNPLMTFSTNLRRQNLNVVKHLDSCWQLNHREWGTLTGIVLQQRWLEVYQKVLNKKIAPFLLLPPCLDDTTSNQVRFGFWQSILQIIEGCVILTFHKQNTNLFKQHD